MIFGNPGYYLDGSNEKFSIIIEHVLNDFYSLNLCVDFQIIPPVLDYNVKGHISSPFQKRSLFDIQSKDLFFLDNWELMQRLIKKSYTSFYTDEYAIKMDLYPKVFTDEIIDAYEDKLEELYYSDENSDNEWGVDLDHFHNLGWFIYIVNFGEDSKIVLIHFNDKYKDGYSDELEDYARFFNEDKSPKTPQYFDPEIWSVEVVQMKTARIIQIFDEALEFIHKQNL